VIFDLPEVSALQRFYLGHAGLPIVGSAEGMPGYGVVTTSEVAHLEGLLRERPTGMAGFLAFWSLAESPVELRERLLSTIGGFDAFAIGYLEQFFDIDNRVCFARWRARLAACVWHDLPLPHLRTGAACYLFGARA
jgi:hypothetical protein